MPMAIVIFIFIAGKILRIAWRLFQMQSFSALLLMQAFPDKRVRKINEEVLAHDAILKNKLDSRAESQRDVSDMIWFIWLFIISVPEPMHFRSSVLTKYLSAQKWTCISAFNKTFSVLQIYLES